MVVIAALIFAGCFSKILLIILYNKLYEDSFRVADGGGELIKQIKLRYSNQIKLDLPIQDAEKFVSRYIYQYSKIIKFANVLDMLSLIVMLMGIALNYEKGYFSTEVLFIAMFIYLSVGMLVDSDKKERIVINNIADYLVNNMNIRSSAKEHREQVRESMKEDMTAQVPTENVVKEPQVAPKTVENAQKVAMNISDDNAIIEEVLREFFMA